MNFATEHHLGVCAEPPAPASGEQKRLKAFGL
jgi:hypothetical protein